AYDLALDAWAEILAGAGAVVDRVSPAEARLASGSVLVVAAAPCLSADARRAMQTAGSRGRGVIFTGLTGVRDAGCRETGYGLLAELVSAARADTVASSREQYITFASGSPLSLGIPPGSRLELKAAPHVAVRHRGRDAYYSDRDLNPLPAEQTTLLDGAVIHEVSRDRRVVYFGFELGTLADRPWEKAMMRTLVRNAVALTAGVPVASVDAWPAGYAAAAVIAQDVEDEFENARPALDTLAAAKVPGTFFVVSDLARSHEKLTLAMASAGEVGTHTENHARLGGDVAVQRRRLRATQNDLTEMLGRPVRGMRPPEEQFDESTLQAWKEVGGRYVFGANDGRSASPEMVRIGNEPFVLIGRVVDDDYLTVRRANIFEPHRLAEDQLRAFAKVRELGGLFVMSYHSNMLARPKTIGALGIVARALKADTTVWLTTAGAVADWWMVRHNLSATVTPESNGALAVTVQNGSPVASLAATVTVTLPDGRRAAAATSGDLPATHPATARVRIPPLAAGASYTTGITLENSGDVR
ncbi:MAG: polysaccharide deacetylase family protein, partial [Gemmatimonadota bacterium]|nr:polysaccharide deacetylase family protein [Gemmatimonadota bacterium]